MSADLFSMLLQGAGKSNPYNNILAKRSENPLFNIGQGISSLAPTMFNPFKSTGSNLAASGLTGLAGALVSGLGARQTRAENVELGKQLSEVLAAEDPNALLQSGMVSPRLAPIVAKRVDEQAQLAREQQEKEADRIAKFEMFEKELAARSAAGREQAQFNHGLKMAQIGASRPAPKPIDPVTADIMVNKLGMPEEQVRGMSYEQAGNAMKALEFANKNTKSDFSNIKAEDIENPFTFVTERIPSISERNRATKEVNEVIGGTRANKYISKVFDEVKEYSSLGMLAPFSEKRAAQESIYSTLFLGIQEYVKGNPSDRDIIMAMGIMPEKTNTVEQLEEKARVFDEWLGSKMTAAPTLRGYGMDPNILVDWANRNSTGVGGSSIVEDSNTGLTNAIAESAGLPAVGSTFQGGTVKRVTRKQ